MLHGLFLRSRYVRCFSEMPEPVNVPGYGVQCIRHHPGDPGFRQENRRFAVRSAYSFRLSCRARSCIHAGHALSARPAPRPACRKRFADLQPDKGVAATPGLQPTPSFAMHNRRGFSVTAPPTSQRLIQINLCQQQVIFYLHDIGLNRV